MKIIPEKIVLPIFCFLLILCQTKCARILGVFHYPGKSQFMGGVALMNILAKRGHEVTMVSPIGQKNPPENYRDIVLPEVSDVARGYMNNYFKYKMHPYFQIHVLSTVISDLMNATLSHSRLKQLLDSEKFDLVILQQFYCDGLTYIPYHLDAPFLFYSPMGASYLTNPSVGNPTFPSFVPDIFLHYSSDMSFFQRIDNTIIFIINEFYRNFVMLPYHDRVVKENFPNAPHISVYNQKGSIVLLNGDPSTNDPVPKVPGMVDIGGFQIKPPRSLPRDLEDILNTARFGAVYFSMGSNLRSVDMPKNILDSIMNVFSKLNQTVIWKWENDELSGKPDNVVIRKWLPQNDILAHKKIKLFVTHAGLHSLQETVYHGVPCLTIPIFIDQTSNAQRAVQAGFAEMIYLEEITEDKLLTLMNKLLENTNYTDAAKRRSRIMRDRPLSPEDTAVFWVDYAIRHKGAGHLRVASIKLKWYQYLLLDIAAFILLCLITIIVIFRLLLKFLLKFRKREEKAKTE